MDKIKYLYILWEKNIQKDFLQEEDILSLEDIEELKHKEEDEVVLYPHLQKK